MTYTTDNVTYSRSDSFTLVQIYSDSLTSLTQIHPISLRFALTHSDTCILTKSCSASCRFTQICSDSQNFSKSHADSLDLVQTWCDPFRRSRIHSDSHSFTPDSFCLPQTHPDSKKLRRFSQLSPDSFELARCGQSRSDSFRFNQPPSNSSRSPQIRSDPFRLN